MNILKITIEEAFDNNGKEYGLLINAEVTVKCTAGEEDEMYHQGCEPEMELYMIHNIDVTVTNEAEKVQGGRILLEMLGIDPFMFIDEHIAENQSKYFEILKQH
jgi:hypothetical protein